MKFRHGASSLPLDESMRCVHEINNLEDIKRLHVDGKWKPFKNAHSCEWYCYDKRIEWDTWIILDKKGCYLGFSNGKLE